MMLFEDDRCECFNENGNGSFSLSARMVVIKNQIFHAKTARNASFEENTHNEMRRA